MYENEQDRDTRRRLGAVLVLLGMGLILASAAMLIYSRPPASPVPDEVTSAARVAPTAEKPAQQRPSASLLNGLAMGLFWLSATILAFLVATWALLRWSRRFRMLLVRRPDPPTPTPDVWGMHRLVDSSSPRERGR